MAIRYLNSGRNASSGYKRNRKQTIPGRKWSESAKTGEEASQRARSKRENQKTPSIPKVEAQTRQTTQNIPKVEAKPSTRYADQTATTTKSNKAATGAEASQRARAKREGKYTNPKANRDTRYDKDFDNFYEYRYEKADFTDYNPKTDTYTEHWRNLKEDIKKKNKWSDSEFESRWKAYDTARRQANAESEVNSAIDVAKKHPALGTLLQAIYTPQSMIEGAASMITSLLPDNYKAQTSDSPLFTGTRAKEAIKQTVKDEHIKSGVGKGAYDIGTGLGDMVIGAGVPVLGTASLGAQTAARSNMQALERGADPNKAALTGAVSGLISGAMNKGGYDWAFGKEAAATTGKEFLKNVGKAAAKEGLENVTEDVVNLGADKLINEDKSEIGALYNYYRSQGLSDSDASIQVLKDKGVDLGVSALSGAAFGGVMSGVNNIPSLMANISANNSPQINMEEFRRGILKLEDINNGDVGVARKSAEQIDKETRQIEEQLGQMANGNLRSDEYLQLGKTPEYMKEYGDINNPLVMSQNNSFKIAYPKGYQGGKHNTGFRAIAEIPKRTDTPVAVMKSQTQPKSGVVVTDMIDSDGNPVSIPIHMDKRSDMGLVNEVASMQGRGNTENLINASDILYGNKERIRSALSGEGLQLPELKADSDPFLNGRVTDSVDNVNPQHINTGGLRQAEVELRNYLNANIKAAEAGNLDWKKTIDEVSAIANKYNSHPEYKEISEEASTILARLNEAALGRDLSDIPANNDALRTIDNGIEWVDPDSSSRISVKGIMDDLRRDIDGVSGRELHPTTQKNVDYLRGSVDRLETAYRTGDNFNEAYDDYRRALNRVKSNMAEKEGDMSWETKYKTLLNWDNPDNIAYRFKHSAISDNIDDSDLPFNDDFIMPEDTGLRRGYNIQDDNIRIDASTAESANAGDRVIPEMEVERLTEQPDTLTTTMRERNYHASSAERGAIPEDIKQALREQDSIDRNTYAQVHNWQTEDKAIELWDNISTFDEAEEQLQRLMRDYDPSAVPFARRLVSAYSKDGNTAAAMKVMDDVSESLTKAGRFTQSAVLGLAKDDPLTALRYAEKQINQINASGAKEFGKKWKNISLTDEEKAMFENIAPGDEAAIKNAMDTIGARIGAEYPTKMMSKLLEGRRLAMLFNMRTLIRNFAANVPTLGMRWTADRIEAIGQNVVHLINPNIEVNQSLIGSGITGRKVASDIYNSPKVQEMLGNISPKYEDSGIKDSLLKNKTMYKGNFIEHWIDDMTGRGIEKVAKLLGKDIKVDGGIQAANKLAFGKNNARSFLETFRNLTYKALDLGDSPFVRENFIERLGSYIRAQGIKNVEDVPDDAIQLAFEEAMKATYKDNSWGYQAVKGIRDAFGKIPVVGKPLGEAAIPFVQAPGNIAARMVDYSPIRGTKGLVDIISGATKSDGDLVKKGIEELSKGLTGSAAVYAGLKLYESGLITGSYASDKDEKQYQKQTGYREWSLRIPGKDGKDHYIKFDWAQPAAEPIMVGALLGDAIQKSDQYDSDLLRSLGIEGSTAGKLIGAGWAGAGASINSWFNASPLQGLQELMGSDMYSSASSDGLSGFAKNLKQTAVDNFVTSFVPAQVGAIAKSIDPIQRNTNDPTNTVNTLINSVKSRIPVVSQTLPAKYDTWGREVTSGADVPEAFMAKNVLPGEYTTDMSTPMDQELVRLSKEANTASVFPPMADKKAGDIQLTNYDMSAQQQDMGQRNYELADAFINSDAYKNMNDADRAKTLSSLYSMSKAITNNNLWNVEIKDSEIANNAKAYNDLGTDSFIEYLGIKKSLPSKGKDLAAVDTLSKMSEEKQDKLLPYLVDTTASKEKTKMWEDSGHDGSTFVKEYQTAKKQQEKQDAEKAEKKNKKADATAKAVGVSKDQLGDLQSQLASYGAIDSPTTVEFYSHAKQTIPSLTPKGYAQKLREIGGDDYKITQKEMLAYANDKGLSEVDMNKYWNAYGQWKRIPYLSGGTWKAK